jgi:hypothetical protein
MAFRISGYGVSKTDLICIPFRPSQGIPAWGKVFGFFSPFNGKRFHFFRTVSGLYFSWVFCRMNISKVRILQGIFARRIGDFATPHKSPGESVWIESE